jgi:NAD(P)-dependent dehydrogenase (short-subunit alcohol dehydrogenase family)
MTPSSYWDESRAARYNRFRYDFPERSLAGRAVIVAGGTGGLGAALVAYLAREGVELIVGYHAKRERADSLRDAMEEQFGRKILLVKGDLSDPEVRSDYLAAAKRLAVERRAILTGVAIFPGDAARVPFESLDQKAIEASLAANYIGPLLLAKEIGESMEPKEGGSVVLLASMQAVAAFPSSVNYAAPKAALVHAARILAQQWSRVRVNVVAPGATVVGMGGASVQAGKYDSYLQNGVISRFGRPEDVARAVRFFLEPDSYTTGQVLVVDGGLTLRRDK